MYINKLIHLIFSKTAMIIRTKENAMIFDHHSLNISSAWTHLISSKQLLGCPIEICQKNFTYQIDAMMQTSNYRNIIFAGLYCYDINLTWSPLVKNMTINEYFHKYQGGNVPNFIDAAAYDTVNNRYLIFKVSHVW